MTVVHQRAHLRRHHSPYDVKIVDEEESDDPLLILLLSLDQKNRESQALHKLRRENRYLARKQQQKQFYSVVVVDGDDDDDDDKKDFHHVSHRGGRRTIKGVLELTLMGDNLLEQVDTTTESKAIHSLQQKKNSIYRNLCYNMKILSYIFSFCCPESLSMVHSTCKFWQRILVRYSLYEQCCKNYWWNHVLDVSRYQNDWTQLLLDQNELNLKYPRCFLDINIDGESIGKIVIELDTYAAPRIAENFRSLCTGQCGLSRRNNILHYRSSFFHRIVPGFICQGGDLVSLNGEGADCIYDSQCFEDPEEHALSHKKGTISMSNKGPNTNGCQFFICMRDCPSLDRQYYAFGSVIKGWDVVLKMNSMGDKDGVPTGRVMIEDCGQIGVSKFVVSKEEGSRDG